MIILVEGDDVSEYIFFVVHFFFIYANRDGEYVKYESQVFFLSKNLFFIRKIIN